MFASVVGAAGRGGANVRGWASLVQVLEYLVADLCIISSLHALDPSKACVCIQRFCIFKFASKSAEWTSLQSWF